MFLMAVFLLGLGACGDGQITIECTASQEDIESVGRVVFIYGQGLSEEAQTGIAFTVANRVNSPLFPNTTHDVVNWEHKRRGKTRKVYGKLTRQGPLRRWNSAKASNNNQYQTALRLSRGVLCEQINDPTDGATDFAAQPTPRMFRGPRNYRARELGVEFAGLYFFKIGPNLTGNTACARCGANGRRQGGRRPGGRRPGRRPGKRPGRRPGRGRWENTRR